ncbi:MFS transporter [Cellulosimicrobium sp. Marseille-Q4280]|uniref:MFS transporter n=1 Tax=Cellulosimicrobium sp. Marseille-Q4280 TaxID=2937992 RepID=UPI00203ACFDD|nr:MFS transporter [Cellulosimicrobium sp. Marseille-Q4280]
MPSPPPPAPAAPGTAAAATPDSSATDPGAPRDARRWWVLVVLALTQLLVVLDGTIVSIALPQAQAELGLSDAQRQWVVTAYALAFGALLLLGGRIADYWGRKRTFLLGMAGFGVASLLAGFAPTGVALIATRGLQGAFAALLAPAALALLTVSFPSGKERNTAFAVFGSVAGVGAAVGLVLGGLLTELADWRWCLWVNVPVTVAGLVAAALLVRESRADGDNRYDVVGTVLVVLGLGALVYGLTLAEHSWTSPATVALLVLGVVLLAAFVVVESRVDQPLLPLRIVRDPVRAGAFLLQAIVGTLMIGALLYLSFHLQVVMGLPPLRAGLGSVPMTLVILVLAPVVTTVLLPRVGPRPLMIAGPLVAAAGLLLLSRVTVDGSYAAEILPSQLVLGVGLALVLVPLQNVALAGVAPHDAGAASATVNAAMQIGGSIGLSVFTTIYASALPAAGAPTPADLVDGYSAVFVAAAVTMALGAVLAFALVRGPKERLLPTGDAQAVHLG